MRYLFIFLIVFISCNSEKSTEIERNIVGKELNNNALNKESFNPPMNHPVKAAFMSVNPIGLKEADDIYKSSMPSSANELYYDNLRQMGFMLLIKNGLIENGTKEQKLYYINEQLESVANIPNFKDFYLLLNSLTTEVSQEVLIGFSNKFYNKNLDLTQEMPVEQDYREEIISRLDEAKKLFIIQ
ncbi:MAG: hypothetical protein ACK4UK_04825 [Flavobacterium sp.]